MGIPIDNGGKPASPTCSAPASATFPMLHHPEQWTHVESHARLPPPHITDVTLYLNHIPYPSDG